MNIQEDYVSFEVAKLLKEKGFDCLCEYQYINCSSGHPFLTDIRDNAGCYYKNSEIGEDEYSAPTLQMAMKWLREVHNLCVEPYRTACGYLYTMSTIPYGSCKWNPSEGGDDEDSGQWTTYEGACEAAIKYALENLI